MFALKTWAMAMGGIRHPLLTDFWPHGAASKSLGLFNEDTGFTNRAMLIIDPDGVVRHSELHTGTLPQADTALAKLAPRPPRGAAHRACKTYCLQIKCIHIRGILLNSLIAIFFRS